MKPALYNSQDSADYLGIPLEEFLSHTKDKARLAYLLQNGRRMYKESELDRLGAMIDERGSSSKT